MAKKATTSTEVAVITDAANVPELLGVIREKLKALKHISETAYKTGGDGKIKGFTNSIQNETSVEELIKMHSSVFGRAKAYDASQARLQEVAGTEISAPTFRENGSSLESIEHDIALKIKVLNLSEEKASLEADLKEIEGFLTREDQLTLLKKRLANKYGSVAGTEE